jgi:hypothetical protein
MIWVIFAALLVGILFAKIFSKESKETIDVQGKSVFISGCEYEPFFLPLIISKSFYPSRK